MTCGLGFYALGISSLLGKIPYKYIKIEEEGGSLLALITDY